MQRQSPLFAGVRYVLHKGSFVQRLQTAKFYSMPVQFLTSEQRTNYGRYVEDPTPGDLSRYFHLNDTDFQLLNRKRGDHNRLVFTPIHHNTLFRFL
jgi:hypothetical protein